MSVPLLYPQQPARWNAQPSGSPAVDRLFAQPAFRPRDAEWERLFAGAMSEAFAQHFEQSREFRAHALRGGYSLATPIRTLADVEGIPWLHVQNFKESELLSVRPEQIVRTFTSSGTGGAQTKLFLDSASLNRIEAAAYAVYEGAGVFDTRTSRCNYLLFTYDIAHAPNLGTAWTDVTIADMLPGGERAFMLRWDESRGEFRFDLDYAIERLETFLATGEPIRLLGFPAFMAAVFVEAAKRGIRPLEPGSAAARDSWILTGGGWKNHLGHPVPKSEFAAMAEQATGIPTRNVRDLFGMSEHGVGYVDCELGRLHVPAYAHAVARDPRTLRIQPSGQPGMLHLYSPLLRSYPSISLLTTDEVIMRHASVEPCACGRPGDGLEYVGRLGLKHHDGCALKALEYLNR